MVIMEIETHCPVTMPSCHLAIPASPAHISTLVFYPREMRYLQVVAVVWCLVLVAWYLVPVPGAWLLLFFWLVSVGCCCFFVVLFFFLLVVLFWLLVVVFWVVGCCFFWLLVVGAFGCWLLLFFCWLFLFWLLVVGCCFFLVVKLHSRHVRS